MEVKFIKDHLDHKAGETGVLADGLSNYLIRVGVVELLSDNDKTEKPKRRTSKPKSKA